MTGGEIAALRWAADYIREVLSGVTADRLGRRRNPQPAQRVLGLYWALGEVIVTADAVIDTLRRWEASPPRRVSPMPDDDLIFSRKVDIPRVALDLEFALEEMANALWHVRSQLDELAPRMEIYAPDVVDDIWHALSARRDVGKTAWRLAADITADADSIGAIRRAAENARSEVVAAAEGTRSFIAQTFSFDELF